MNPEYSYYSLSKSKVAHIHRAFGLLCGASYGGGNYINYINHDLPEGKGVCTSCSRVYLRETAIQIIPNAVSITIADVLNAIDENGFRHKHGDWFGYDQEGNIVAACILGQAAINLGVTQNSLVEGLNAINSSGRKIISYNDKGGESSYRDNHKTLGYKTVAKFAHELLEDFKDRAFIAKQATYRAKKKVDNV